MANPVVHVEVIGTDPALLRSFYGDLFGWQFTSREVAVEVSASGKTASSRPAAPDGWGPARGTGGGLLVGQFTDPEGHLIGVVGPV